MRRSLPPPAFYAAVSLVLLLLPAARAAAMCTRDADCKGGRICDMGRCVAPAGGAAALAPGAGPAHGEQSASGPAAQASTDRPGWYRGYFEHGLALTLHGWGGASDELNRSWDLEADALLGTRMAGYAVLSERLHLGGYFAYYGGKLRYSLPPRRDPSVTYGSVNFGFAMKAGGRVGRRVWLGCALDVGASFWSPDAGQTLFGFQINPAFDVDVLALAAGKFRLGFFGSFGPQIIPFAGNSERGLDVSIHLVNLALILGITLGAG